MARVGSGEEEPGNVGDCGQAHWPHARLDYFDRTRRELVQLTGLAVAGALLAPRLGAAAPGPALPVTVTEALAAALAAAGVKVVTHVPATGASAVFETTCQRLGIPPAYSLNEEVAYTVAHGAAVAGARAAAILKSHGLAKAANSVVDSLTMGVTAGLVAVVVADPAGEHSDNVFDLTAFLQGTGMPFKVGDPATLHDALLECFLWSEELRTPVAFYLTTRELGAPAGISSRRLGPPAAAWARDPLRQVLCPLLAPYQKLLLDARLARREWRQLPVPALPTVPAGLPDRWRAPAARLEPVLGALGELRPRVPVVCGDTGLCSLFAFPPHSAVDLCSYYGGSLPLASGFLQAGIAPAVAVTGDYAFLAAGHMGLLEAAARGLPLKVLVMDNGAAMATGGQPVPPGALERVLAGWQPAVTRLKSTDDAARIRETLARALLSSRLEVVVADARA